MSHNILDDDDICWDESGFSSGAGAPKKQEATTAMLPCPACHATTLVTLSRHDVQALDAQAGAD